MISARRLAALLGAAIWLACATGASAAAVPAWSPIAVSGPTNLAPLQSEIQRVGVDAEGGTFKLTYNAQTTPSLPYNATATEVQSALNNLSTIGGAGGSVSVAGGPGSKDAAHPYFVTFGGGALTNTDALEMSVDSSALTGGGTHTATVKTTVPGGPGTTDLAIYMQNIGGTSSKGQISATVTLPAGITTSKAPAGSEGGGKWSCPSGTGLSSFTCTTNEAIGPSLTPEAIKVPIVEAGATTGTKTVTLKVSGGEAADAEYKMPLTISAAPAPAGFQVASAGAYNDSGQLDTRAGAHPYAGISAVFLNTARSPLGVVLPSGEFKDIVANLPPGFLGNPVAVPQCPESTAKCPVDTIVGVTQPITAFGQTGSPTSLFNIEAPFGYAAKLRFNIVGVEQLNAVGGLRSDEDYGLQVSSLNTPQIEPVFGFFFTFWGAPADQTHNDQRCVSISTKSGCEESDVENVAFLTNPTNCAEEALIPPVVSLNFNTWQQPEQFFHEEIELPPAIGCDELHFEGAFAFQPTEAAKADSPTAFTTDLSTPSKGLIDPDPKSRTNPELKKTVVRFPAGVVLNPAAADGLAACSEEQIGLKGTSFKMPNPIRFNKDPNHCPDASKVGTVDVKTALLAKTLQGALYLARQNENPFGSLFAVYLVIEDPQTGVTIKLPGEVVADPATGQLTATFENLPQLPFTELALNFKGGPRSPMSTPNTCGAYTTVTEMTPWSAPESGLLPTISENSFTVGSGPNGTPCANTPAQRPFNLGLKAGAANPIAGAFSPFSIQLTRPDGAQELDTVSIATPPGFTASLKGVPYCSEAQIAAAERSSGAAEQARPSCPAASQVGATNVGAGSGPNPFYTPGKLFLAGPYKGAPLSVVAVTPAVAGPFDLGDVVVRSALHVDPVSARVTATTDPLPRFLKGVALRIRDIRINLDRSNWALNPTNCNASAVDVSAHGSDGAVAGLSNRFQVSGCSSLAFKPKLRAKLIGGTHRNDHPALRATVTYPPGGGYANTAFAQVALPHSEFLENGHINTICTRTQFAADQCPAGSIYGHAEAVTPLLDQPLTGNVYLRSSSNKLPDLVVALKGPPSQPIEVDLDGRIDSIHGGIRTTFEGLPDAPVSRFTLAMQGGKKGLLVNSRNLCAKPSRMTVRLIGQNGKRADQFPKLGNGCHKAKQHRHKKHHKH